MGKLLAVVITYYPDKELLLRNINAFLTHVDKVLIWENTPTPESEKYRFITGDQIEYQTRGYNVGISVALNYSLKYAQSQGYEYILTMDQDSCFENFKTYREKAISKLQIEESIIGPIINADTLKDEFSSISTYIITSGVLARVSTLLSIGGYCEEFKVDAIDLELCLRAHANNIPIYRYLGCQLIQQFGTPDEIIIFGRKIVTCGYSPFRLFGIFRNHIITYRRYNHSPYVFNLIKIYYRHLIPGIICIDKDKFKKLWAIIKGTYKGLTY